MPNFYNVFIKNEIVFNEKYGVGRVIDAKYIPSIGGVSIVQFDNSHNELYKWNGAVNCRELKSHELMSLGYFKE